MIEETLSDVMSEINQLIESHDFPAAVLNDIWLRLQGNRDVCYAKLQLRYLKNVKKYHQN